MVLLELPMIPYQIFSHRPFPLLDHRLAQPMMMPLWSVPQVLLGRNICEKDSTIMVLHMSLVPVGSIGDCTMDTFSLTSPGNVGSPVICGFNTGQHMIVDASSACHKASFGISSSSSTSRQWDIKVTHYGCGDSDIAGEEKSCVTLQHVYCIVDCRP